MEKETNYNISKKLQNKASDLSGYQVSLLLPGLQLPYKIPGTWGRRSIMKHVYTDQQYQVNAAGHLAFQYSVNEILDSAGTKSSSYVTTNASAYDPTVAITTLVNQTCIDTRPYYNLTTGTAKACRVVSARVTAYSTSPALTRQGTLYGVLLHSSPNGSATFGVQPYEAQTIPYVNAQIMKQANVSNGEGVAVNWIPSDEDDLAFLAPNTEVSQRHPLRDDVYHIIIIAEGLAANSYIRFKIDVNYEIVPEPGSSLAGFESIAPPDNAIPALQIAHLKAYHRDDLIRIVTAYDTGLSINSLSKPKLNAKINNNNEVTMPLSQNSFIDKGKSKFEKKNGMSILEYNKMYNNMKKAAQAIVPATGLALSKQFLGWGGAKRQLGKNSKKNKTNPK